RTCPLSIRAGTEDTRPIIFISTSWVAGLCTGLPVSRGKRMSESEKELPISPELLEILRCPVAVHYTDRGQDPGRLRLVHNCWLVSDDSGLKYPIRDGIPVMLVEEGEKWKDVPEDQLPVPPPPEE